MAKAAKSLVTVTELSEGAFTLERMQIVIAGDMRAAFLKSPVSVLKRLLKRAGATVNGLVISSEDVAKMSKKVRGSSGPVYLKDEKIVCHVESPKKYRSNRVIFVTKTNK